MWDSSGSVGTLSKGGGGGSCSTRCTIWGGGVLCASRRLERMLTDRRVNVLGVGGHCHGAYLSAFAWPSIVCVNRLLSSLTDKEML